MIRSILALSLVCTTLLGAAGAQAQDAAERKAAVGLGVAGQTVPGGNVLASARVVLTPAAGGAATVAPIAADGTFAVTGLAPGRYRLALASPPAVPKQTQGATFGEKVNQGLQNAGSAIAQGGSAAKTRHDTVKNSIGNIRGKLDPNNMPNRISMNMTIARQSLVVELDGEAVDVEIAADGRLAGRVGPR